MQPVVAGSAPATGQEADGISSTAVIVAGRGIEA
jgi:hypothetical protein